jgi:hypothetical protein
MASIALAIEPMLFVWIYQRADCSFSALSVRRGVEGSFTVFPRMCGRKVTLRQDAALGSKRGQVPLLSIEHAKELSGGESPEPEGECILGAHVERSAWASSPDPSGQSGCCLILSEPTLLELSICSRSFFVWSFFAGAFCASQVH